jgi:hypothetical protein
MSGTLARSDREAKEAAERRAQLAETRVRDLEERLDRALAAITDARAERDAVAWALDEFAPRDTGVGLAASVALLRARLSERVAEIEGVDGWRVRLDAARAEGERLASLWESKAAWLTTHHRDGSGAVARANTYRECAIAARAALVSPSPRGEAAQMVDAWIAAKDASDSPSPRPAENEGNEAKENA